MKKEAVLSVVFSLVLFVGLLSAQEHQGPRIEVREMRYDFGKVVQGTQVSHVFEVKSVGGEALEIERVQPS